MLIDCTMNNSNVVDMKQKFAASAAIAFLIVGLAYGAGTNQAWILTACALGIGTLFGMTFVRREKRAVVQTA